MTCHATGSLYGDCAILALSPDCIDIVMPYGTDNELTAVLKDGDGKAVPINTDTITLTVKDGRGGTLIFQKTNAPGAHTDPAQGETVFAIAATDISTADPYSCTTWLYELRRTTNGGLTYVHLSGRFVVSATI